MEIQDGSAKFVVKDIRENEQEIQKNKTDISEVQAEQQRLSQALTGYVPLDWSNITKTPLIKYVIKEGDITLEQPYTNFDYLLICSSNDDTSYRSIQLLSKFELDFMLNELQHSKILLVSGASNYWWINGKTSTSTVLKGADDNNASIVQIYGIKINN